MGTLNTLTQFRNCYILRNHKIIREDLWVRQGKLVDPEKVFFDEKEYADQQIDCKGALVAPGFIDVQINGGFGVDFSYDTDVEDGIQKVAKGILKYGVTSFCPTLVTSPADVYHKVLPRIKRTRGGKDGASVLGLHVEGPFISPQKNGAHPIKYIQELKQGFTTIEDIYGRLDNVSVVTIAPELNGAIPVIQEFVKRGITVSLGHSMANLSQGEMAVQHGATFITHLFNAMLPFHHRDPGLVGLLTSDAIPAGRTVYYGIIADGIHTHPAALRIAHHAHPKGLVLVTDAISAMGLKEGQHRIGQMTVEVKGDRAYVSGTETLCGSILTMDKCVQFFKEATGCSQVEALEAATLHPAQTLGIVKRKGTLDFETDADFVFLDPDFNVWSTWIAGECVYQNSSAPSVEVKSIEKD